MRPATKAEKEWIATEAARLSVKERCVCCLCKTVHFVTLPHKPNGKWFCNSCEIDDETYVAMTGGVD